MKNNKSYFKMGKLLIIPLLILSLLFSSCTKNLDLSPASYISEDAAFTSKSLIALSVTGMYNAAQMGYYNNAPRGYPFGAAFIEQGDCRGEDVVNTAAFYQFTYTATYSTTTLNNVWMWSDTYRLLNRCNIVIDGVNKAVTNNVITDVEAAVYEAEARLFRALSYHEMLIHFARPYKHTADASHLGIPMYSKPITNLVALDEAKITGRSTVAQVYSQILADLDYAEANLPLKADRAGSQKISRATKGAAIALKSRIYLHMENWNKVVEESSKFVAGGTLAGTYSLTTDPNSVFGTTALTNTESIFSLENAATNNPGVNAALASQYNRRNLVCISPIIWRNPRWWANDKRRTEAIMVRTGAGGVKYTKKYKDSITYTDPTPIIRYAEVMLNLAEAYARNNDVTNALAYLNLVRNRSLADPATQAYVAGDFADNVALLGAILDERRIEFVMEGRRWSDITRLQKSQYFAIDGIPAKIANGTPAASTFTLGTPYDGPYGVAAIPYDDFRYLWPIPLDETNANPLLKEQQNPGW